MKLHRHVLSTLVLFAALPLLAPLGGGGTAHARSKRGEVPPNVYISRAAGDEASTLWLLVPDDAAEIASVSGEVSSDDGEEEVTLVETDAWLHGTATLAAEPSAKATIGLTLYDKGSSSILSFTGAHVGGGSVVFSADSVLSCDNSSKMTCSDGKPAVDVGVLAAELFPTASGYELALDLDGADTWEIAYAELVVTESTKERTVAEVDWRVSGSVWSAELEIAHTGALDVDLDTRDAAGDKLDTVKAELGEPWADDGGGVSTLVSDEDPLSRVGLLAHHGSDSFSGGHVRTPRMTLLSEGWDSGTYPTHAEVELAGASGTVAANSFQRLRKRPELLFQAWDATLKTYLSDAGSTLTVTVGSVTLPGISARHADTPLCSSGTCVVLLDTDEGYALSVTAYATSVAALPSKRDLSVVLYSKSGEKLASETGTVEFDEEVSALFAAELDLQGDPVGQDASGKVKLLGAAGEDGARGTLSSGHLRGAFSRDGDGDLAFGGAEVSDAAKVDTSFAVLLGGEVECGGDGCDGDWAPPVVLYRDRIGAYVVGVKRVSAGIKLKGGY